MVEPSMELPTGTVSLLFSDIEGSTALLWRLGAAYADALDGHRQILRAAWARHHGVELGTEGDSFFVAFATAPDAVGAAVQAQRDLDGFEWPGGVAVRVRMGIHTGNPTVHGDGYVGMDVHRAARIAGAAHGGQVVLSSATAGLVREKLPEQVHLKDLGSHHLKDIAYAEHVFQLVVEGLLADFPALKTLGSASSLPVPATPLVGRDGELAELTALFKTPQVRLVTLTGPGGSGKTRLAIGVAERLTEPFSDGLYFVDLAATTTSDVMWTTIAEAMDLPPEGRIPPGFFSHVAHRSALIVLDNLEQVDGADAVVVELLKEAPQVVVIATSRRPLGVPGELQHAVPPLELPDDSHVDQAAESGAVQLFVQAARSVRSTFTLTTDNAADVVAICRGLDGLPLAIELAAARSKVLSPHALLARLATALDLKAPAVGRPTRQQRLRDTIAWSYDLLGQEQQAFFRRLGVFAGGADLDAIGAVCEGIPDTDDPLDAIGELVDANLALVIEDANGEPRIGMLVTIRAYAHDQLDGNGELATVQRRHAEHYSALAEELSAQSGPQQPAAMRRFETELDNFREVLGYAFQTAGNGSPSTDEVELGRRLCKAIGAFWNQGGYYDEERRWFERSVDLPIDEPNLLLCNNLTWLANTVNIQGDFNRSRSLARTSVDTARPFGDTAELVDALRALAMGCLPTGDEASARVALHEALEVAFRIADPAQTAATLFDLGAFEGQLGNHRTSLQLNAEALTIFEDIGDALHATMAELNTIWDLAQLGNLTEAHDRSRALIDRMLASRHPGMIRIFAGNHAVCLLNVGEPEAAARLTGSADAMRERLGVKNTPIEEAEFQAFLIKCKEAMRPEDFQRAYEAGRAAMVEDLLTELKSL